MFSYTKYFDSKNSESICIKEFLVNEGLKRQYHTLIDWESKNANPFFALFGQEFKKFMNVKVSEDGNLKESIISFIELGNERNRLVHQNFGSYSIEKTLEEILNSYQKSLLFVESLIDNLEVFHKSILEISNHDDFAE
ncbi:HEPN domain-containing protein [Kaistella palustris]|uniref:HEPN domain-containing protein n=1 Tax=Kaistella palustris TaxID=493376 RepID=UPI000684D081|nr:HEPN domain-containing protein [Kaistella palustris]